MADTSSRIGLSTVAALARPLVLSLLLLVVAARALAAGVNLAWDPVTSSSLAGYMVYYGPAVGTYPSKIDVGNTTTYTVTGLTEGTTYHFAVTAYDPSRAESGYSNDAATTVPYSAPVAQFTGTPTSGAVPLTVNFSNASVGSITSYAWTFGDGGTSTVASPSHVYAAAGTYTVGLTVTGPGGINTQSRINYVTVGTAPPVAQFTGTPTSGAVPLTVNFSNASVGSITSYAWTFGDGGTSTVASPSHVYAAAGTYTVGLTVTGPGGSNTQSRTNYVTVTTGMASFVPDLNQHGLTGSWYEPATDGQGAEIEVFPDLVAPGTGSVQVSWFTFDTVAGGADRQRWYTLSGSVVSGQPNAALTIYQNTGGNFNAPPITNGVPVGTATLSFDTCTSGQLSYHLDDGRAGDIPLTRITQNVTCSTTSARPTNADFTFSGNWYNPVTSGQGFVVEVNPLNRAVFVTWYTYAPGGAGAGADGQRWYTASGAFAAGSRSIPIDIRATTGGAFDAPTVLPPTSSIVGSGILAFQSCSTATFSYNFSGGTSSGMSGTIALSRIGPVPAGCAY